jgi:hypothetical protein
VPGDRQLPRVPVTDRVRYGLAPQLGLPGLHPPREGSTPLRWPFRPPGEGSGRGWGGGDRRGVAAAGTRGEGGEHGGEESPLETSARDKSELGRIRRSRGRVTMSLGGLSNCPSVHGGFRALGVAQGAKASGGWQAAGGRWQRTRPGGSAPPGATSPGPPYCTSGLESIYQASEPLHSSLRSSRLSRLSHLSPQILSFLMIFTCPNSARPICKH